MVSIKSYTGPEIFFCCMGGVRFVFILYSVILILHVGGINIV